MKTHIVIRNPNDDLIIPRIFRLLRDSIGGTMGTAPRSDVDANIFSTYIEWGEYSPGWNATPTAAYFSHRETDVSNKQVWWDVSAVGIDLKLVTAARYARLLNEKTPGNIHQFTPPLDLEAFNIRERTHKGWMNVGTSGFVSAASNRKGAHLLGELAANVNHVNWSASGAGWPIRTEMRDVSELPAFYQGLDLYVCASLVEGIPMPVLEALACGIPVLIPLDVGLLDELPEMDGIWRYERGSISDMHAQFMDIRARVRKVDREALREVVLEYTPENFVRSFMSPIEAFIFQTNFDPPKKDWKDSHAIYSVAYGSKARRVAGALIQSIQQQMPKTPVFLAADSALSQGEVWVEHPDVDIGGRTAKLSVDANVPAAYEYILYMDADTALMQPVTFIFEALASGWEFIICINPSKYVSTREMHRPDNQLEVDLTFDLLGDDNLIQLNGGVFAYRRCTRTSVFMQAWFDEWNRFGGRDQPALLRALYKHPVRMLVLNNLWNYVDRYDDELQMTDPVVMHYPMTARRWEGLVHGRLDSQEAWGLVHE